MGSGICGNGKYMTKHGKSIKERLYLYININSKDDCWEWVGYKRKDGYGEITIDKKTFRSHRLIYIDTYGSIPEGMCICHSCDNPSCCNPNHLFMGTHVDNMKDCRNKCRTGGGSRPGEECGKHKFTNEEILDIRKKYKTGLYSQRNLAKEYNMSQTNIKDIINRKIWRHI